MCFFTCASKNVHTDINTYDSVNCILANNSRIPSGPKMLKKAKEIAVKRLESKNASRIHLVSL